MNIVNTVTRVLLAATATLALLASCGGGVGTGGTGSFAQGTITGFGSVIVNGVHFDVGSATQVQDGDGNAHSADDLRLGMTVDIDGGAITNTGSGSSASADSIRYASELVGPLAAVDRSAGLLTLLGQTVQVDATTVFDDGLAGGLAALFAGRLVEVYAAFDPASGRYRATRIEARDSASNYRLRGVVGQLDSVAAKSFRIGNALFAYGGASAVPPSLANGDFVRLRLQPAAPASASWTVVSFAAGEPLPADGLQAKVKGFISVFTSPAQFSVNGQRVLVSGIGGNAGLALGVRVEVEGTLQGGVLQATQITITSDQEEGNRQFELRGPIGALDSSARTFTLRGVTVSYAGAVTFKDGTEAQLANDTRVEIKGRLSSDGTRVEASEIRFDH